MLIWKTIQPEEVIWVAIALYALIRVHIPALREARNDVAEATVNNRRLDKRTRTAALIISKGRQTAERFFIVGWLLNAGAGIRSMFTVPAANRPRSGTLLSIGLLVLGAIMMTLASRAWTRARAKVRAMRGGG